MSEARHPTERRTTVSAAVATSTPPTSPPPKPSGPPYPQAELADALRLAITQIPTTSWQPMETAPDSTWVRLLVVDESGCRSVQDCSHDAQGWWVAGEGYLLTATPLAWRPADSTELPEDLMQLETMPHLVREQVRQAGEHKASHAWVPIAECGELADGEYDVVGMRCLANGTYEQWREQQCPIRGGIWHLPFPKGTGVTIAYVLCLTPAPTG